MKWLAQWLETSWQDLCQGGRVLRKSPEFTLVAVLTLGLGIGANTAIFSIVNGLLLRPLAVAQPAQLTYLVIRHGESWSNGVPYADFEEVRKASGAVFSQLVGVQAWERAGLSVKGKTETIYTQGVTTNLFAAMGIQPALGSFFMPEGSALDGSDPVLVLGYGFWKTRFGGDPGIVGHKASINGHPVTIIGIAPQGFHGISNLVDTQGFMPLGLARSLEGGHSRSDPTERDLQQVLAIGRLREGTDLGKAQSVLAVIANRLAAEYPKGHEGLMLRPVELGVGFVNPRGENPVPVAVALFMILAGLVLVLAATNLANLLLVKAVARNREMAVRCALGAVRVRLARQVFTETLVLALLGGAAGVVLGYFGSRIINSIPLQTGVPIVLDFHFDWRVFSYALAAALVVALVAGLLPAWRTFSGDLNQVLREATRKASPRHQRLRTTLVVSQVAGSLMLLIVAGLFVRSLQNVQHTDLGFDPRQVVNFSLDAHGAGYNEVQGRQFYVQLLERVRTAPGVESASLAQMVPLGLDHEGVEVKIEGYQASWKQEKPSAGYNAVSPGYFRTMHIPLLRGREILDSDNQNAPHVALINQAMGERYWPGQDPIGLEFTRMDAPQHPIKVIGIVRNARIEDITGPIGPYFFVPLAQSYVPQQILQIRTASADSAMIQTGMEIVHSLEPAVPVFEVQTMNQVLQGVNGFLIYRVGVALAAALGLLALALAIVGVYGVVSYTAAQRTHEIGIRIALGAQPGGVIKTILRQGMVIVIFGIVAGVLTAAGIAKLVGSFLVGVSAVDPLTYTIIPLVLAAIALFASFIPALRATRVDPMVALRHD